jgi:hypothetical protein
MAPARSGRVIRAAAGFLALFVVGFPLLRAPGSVTELLGLIAATLCAGGILGLSIPLLAAGATLAVVEYAFASLVAGGPPDVLGALAFGAALSLLLQTVGFAARFHGVSVAPQVLRGQVRVWVGTGAAGVMGGLALAGGAGFVWLRLPAAAYPVVVALGLLVAFAGVVLALLRRTEPPPSAAAAEESRRRADGAYGP